ncbi:MAG: molybdopterin-dependent oxidoreductase [Candidatus Kapabacteria bacterium]|nr:molybdopterin-dependent oxidoreductase [Candidatus Kapabacteria bacterium]
MENYQNTESVNTRRNFLLQISTLGTGLILSGLIPANQALAQLIKEKNEIQSFIPNVWLEVQSDNTVIITIGQSELGQGTRTSLAMAVADEMDADWANVKIVQGNASNAKYGSQSTGGSSSITGKLTIMRQAGATARAMFITAAAQTWNIAESACKADAGYILEIAGSRKLSYGDLSTKAATLPVPTNLTLKTAKDFKYIGSSKPVFDCADIVMGKTEFGIDAKVTGLKYAMAAFPPTIGASVKSYDDTDTLKIPGVLKTFKAAGGVAVVADNTYAAMQGVEALKISWNMGSNTGLNSDVIYKSLTDKIGTLDSLPGNTIKTLEATYQVPFLAHAPMEPMNCTVNIQGTTCEVWVSSQDSQSVQATVASATGISAANVTVHSCLSGGGFGRRSNVDYANYAASIAKQSGYPIKFLYSRKNDIQRDNSNRPASVHALKAGLDTSGKITGWVHRGIYAGGGSVGSPPYSLPSPKNYQDAGNTTVPTGAWRSVSASQCVFAIECFIDEIALAAAKDPLDFRLGISNNSRVTAVLNELKTRSNWTNPLPKGSGRGVSIFSGWGGYCGHVVEVTVNNGILKVDRAICVVDVGFALNLFTIESQMMGGIIDGLSTATRAEITIAAGAVEQTGYGDFQWFRMNEAPKIEVYIIHTGTSPSGVGELGFPTVTPALCNAIYNAIGVRIRRLPISYTELKSTSVKEEINRDLIKVNPNPFGNEINIDLTNVEKLGQLECKIYDISGNLIYMSSFPQNFMANNYSIDSSNFISGTYILRISTANKHYTAKIQKV